MPEYFVNYTLTTDYQSQIESFVTGSTRKRISRANLGGIVIPVPRIDKQKQFVEIYKHIDKLKFDITKLLLRIKIIKKESFS